MIRRRTNDRRRTRVPALLFPQCSLAMETWAAGPVTEGGRPRVPRLAVLVFRRNRDRATNFGVLRSDLFIRRGVPRAIRTSPSTRERAAACLPRFVGGPLDRLDEPRRAAGSASASNSILAAADFPPPEC